MVRFQQITVLFGIFKQVFEHVYHMLDVLRRHTVEAEAFRLLALPEKVVQKAVQRVAILVEQ